MRKARDPITDLSELRRRIAAIEGCLPSQTQFEPSPASAARERGTENNMDDVRVVKSQPRERLSLGLPDLDRLFAREGLASGALHEIVSAQSRDGGALSGFACALLARVMQVRAGAVLWVLDPAVRREAGQFYGAGLAAFGIDPSRIVLVLPRQIEELLWVMEEGARCEALAGVVAEVQGGGLKALDLTATRRLALRAGIGGVPAFLLRHGAHLEPTAAMTRWCVAPRPSFVPDLLKAGPHDGLGRCGWHVELTRNRDGQPGRADLEWNHETRSFAAPARSLALVSGSALRQGAAPGSTGKVVAFPG